MAATRGCSAASRRIRQLLALEAEAKAARRGLWRDLKPVPPWLWRERQALLPTRTTLREPAF